MKCNVVVIPKPVDLWVTTNILDRYYKAKGTPEEKDVAYEFQTFTIATRLTEAMAAINGNPDADIYLLEYS